MYFERVDKAVIVKGFLEVERGCILLDGDIVPDEQVNISLEECKEGWRQFLTDNPNVNYTDKLLNKMIEKIRQFD